jgi:tetratricopeptide (TPR) repeat protein
MDVLGAGRRRLRREAAEVARGRELLAEGEAEEAERLLGLAVRGREARYGAEAFRVLVARHEHARALFELGRAAEAEAAFDLVVAYFSRLHGAHSNAALAVSLSRGEAQVLCGRYVEAEAVARDVAARLDPAASSDPSAVRLRNSARLLLAQAVGVAGRHGEALGLFIQAASEARRELGADDRLAIAPRLFHVGQLHLLDRDDEAQEVASALLADTSRRNDDLAASSALMHIATLSPSARVPAARRALAVHEARLGARHRLVHGYKAELAIALSELGQHEEALAVVATVQVPSPRTRASWALARATVLHAAGRPGAAEAAHEAVRLWSSRYGPTHHGVLESRTLLAAVCGTPAERTAAADAWEANFGSAHARTVAARKAALR